MAFLSLNGVEIDVLNESYQETVEEIGETSRAYNGTLRKSRQTIKRVCQFDTPPMLSADALAWDGFIRGLGHSWSFDTDLYSSKGLKPNATTGLSVSTGTNGKNSTEALKVAFNATPRTAVYAASLGSSWTVMLWRKQTAGGTYAHYVVNSSSQKWVDGVRNDAASTTFISVSSGTLTLTGHATDDVYFDDVVAVPYVMPTDWPPLLYTFNASTAYPAIPKLAAQGDIVHEATTRTVMGNVTQSRPIKAVVSSSFRTNARTLSVELAEV